eukprot:GHUV01040230.1.p1 GENE.GHUV01040230.1~~GHUV01040230.1.p1  ORF type:complete len:164 (+),score=33.45 GHUV01040230.1:133-624(+)
MSQREWRLGYGGIVCAPRQEGGSPAAVSTDMYTADLLQERHLTGLLCHRLEPSASHSINCCLFNQDNPLETYTVCCCCCCNTVAQVWSLRVDVHVLDSAGNLVDVCCLAALAALLGFRKPQVEVDQSAGEGEAQVIVHPPEVRALMGWIGRQRPAPGQHACTW